MAENDVVECEEQWWEEEPVDLDDEDEAAEQAERVRAWAKRCRDLLADRRRTDLLNARLTLGFDIHGIGPTSGRLFDVMETMLGQRERSRFNVMRAALDTAASIICNARPMPMALTVDGDFSQQRRVRLMTKGLVALFRQTKAHKHSVRAFHDANMASLGVVHGFLDAHGRPALERVNPFEIVLDPAECVSGRIPGLCRIRPQTLDEAIDAHPDFEERLRESTTARTLEDKEELGIHDRVAKRMLITVEVWRAASKHTPGRYTKVVGGILVCDEEFRETEVPFAFYRFADRLTGPYGQGIAELSVDTQIRVNNQIRKVDRLQDLMSNAHVVLDSQADLKPEAIKNAPAVVYRVQGGRAPQFITTTGTPPDVQQSIDKELERLLFTLGLSESSASGERAPGVYSGVGMRSNDDIQSRRLKLHLVRWEEFHLEIAELLKRLCERAYRKDRSFAIDVEERRGASRMVRTYEWRKIRPPKGARDKFQIFPVANLPSTPTGKLELIQDFRQAGYVNPLWAMSMMDLPEAENMMATQLADLNWAFWAIEQIIEGEGMPHVPDYLKHDQVGEVIRAACIELRIGGAEADVVEQLESLFNALGVLAGAMKPPAAPVAPGQAGLDPAALAAQGVPAPQLAGVPPAPAPAPV